MHILYQMVRKSMKTEKLLLGVSGAHVGGVALLLLLRFTIALTLILKNL